MPEEAPMQPEEQPLQPELPPEIPTEPPGLPEGPTPSRKGGWKRALAAIIVIAVVAGGVFVFGGKLMEPNYHGPTAAFILSGEDVPTGWFLMQRTNLTEEAAGFVDGSVSLIEKQENAGEDVSTVFSYAWLFNDSSSAKVFEESLWKEETLGNYSELNVDDIEGCRGLVKPFPLDGDWAFVFCRNGNLVWKVESRSTIKAAHLYAPMFVNAVAEKIKSA